MPTLVGGNGNALHVFLNGCVDNFAHRAIVSQVDDFGTRALQDAAHDVDGSIVAIEEGGGGD